MRRRPVVAAKEVPSDRLVVYGAPHELDLPENCRTFLWRHWLYVTEVGDGRWWEVNLEIDGYWNAISKFSVPAEVWRLM